MKRTGKLNIGYPRHMVCIGLACTLAMLVLCGGPVEAQTQGLIVLEDFSSMRMNHDTPPDPLWSPYTGGTSLGPGQQGSLGPGYYHDVVPNGQEPEFQFFPYPYNLPTGFAKGNLLSGTWDPNTNRMTFWMRVNGGSGIILHKPGGDQTASVGTYTKVADNAPSNQGDHYYHYLYANWYPGQWMLVTINRVPQHEVGQDPNINWPENPTAWTGNPQYHGSTWNYFDGLTRFYFEPEYADLSQWGGRSYDFADFEFNTVTSEPDQLVASVTATYTGSGYELSWCGPKNTVQSYNVYYAQISMHANGLSAGTKDSQTVSTPGDSYCGAIWSSPAMSQRPGGMYFAIQPVGSSQFTEIYLPISPRFTGTGTSTLPHAPTNLRIGN